MNNIKTYKYDSRENLTVHISAKEVRCKCTNHDTKIDLKHLENIESFMSINGYTKIIISSGYRCSKHDKDVGGSGSGQHTKGTAIDCKFYKGSSVVDAKEVCCKAQDYGFKGIAYINSSYVHLDNRATGTYRGDERKGTSNNVGNDFYSYFGISNLSHYSGVYPSLPSRGYFKKGDKGTEVKHLQSFLNWSNSSKLVVDGIIGNKTIEQVKAFQKLVNIKQDGLFGKTTLSKAKGFTK